MIVLVLIIAVMVGILATYAVEARHERRHRRLAEAAGRDGLRLVRVDGIDSPTAAEGLVRGSYPPGEGWGDR